MGNIQNLENRKQELLEQYNDYINQIVYFQNASKETEVKTILKVLNDILIRIRDIDISIALQNSLQNTESMSVEIKK